MPYTAEISRANPTCFLFLLDQSRSMGRRFGGPSGRTLAEELADALNSLLSTLVRRCRSGADIWDRYFVGIIGYGGSEEDENFVGLGFPGEALADDGDRPEEQGGVLRSISRIGKNPLRIEQRTRSQEIDGRLVETSYKFSVWCEPLAAGKTPMCKALQVAQEVVANFIRLHPACFPPIVINITDGAATDGNPEPAAGQLRELATEDGQVLLFNIHISPTGECPILFPAHPYDLPDLLSAGLFRMSSPLPPSMLAEAQLLEQSVAEGARGFAFNANLEMIVSFLNIGTMPGRN